ncbi:vesicle-associated membrane protein-associated protein B/C [Ctenocephalides felis]|uniref:vesicle-associated membrane protein-associated protein B/C n=1 Tax=Ctenocephalides felis TaxID=7515 RepID=UPI000E6E1FD0|nr:vesicle-associated membrane protein-associated protein B/C [Ctenocephalides felis]XP_026472667.1 vesicle-associated membrane protein-associated protein B/C [Ctenocephalides felis]
MSKPSQAQILVIDPQNELKFRGPFEVPVTSYMKLINPSEKKVFFKIKTTAPKKYCVRPNSGAVDPKGVIEVAICLQPFKYDPQEKNKHKFMVQTVIAPEGETNIEALWKDLKPEQLMDSKLKCVFELPEGTVIKSDNSYTTNATVCSQEGYDAVDDNVKSMGDNNKIQPKLEATESELQKVASELARLREEERVWKSENDMLKTEVSRLRSASSSGAKFAQHTNSYSPPANQQQVSPFLIGIAVFIGIFGFIIGKFIL